MATKKKVETKTKTATKATTELITRPRLTTKMRAIEYLESRGPGEFTVPEIREALSIRQQHAFAIVKQLTDSGDYFVVGDDRKRGKRGTYTTESPK